jgi:hypothetical protein
MKNSAVAQNIIHGSHPHFLMAAVTPGLASGSLSVACSICKAVVPIAATCEQPSPLRCTECEDFFICLKCFEVKERPFTCTQIVIRNPSLSSFDHSVCVRTRPRCTSYNLCPLFHGQLIEVVAFAESTEGDVGVMYFRQRMGGWINSQHVVCVFPSDASIGTLVQMHFAARKNLPVVTSTQMILDLIKESSTMISEDASYGSISAYFTLLPLYKVHMNMEHAKSQEVLRPSAQFVDFLLRFTNNELRRLTASFNRADTSSAFVVRLAARCLAVLEQLVGCRQPVVPHETIAVGGEVMRGLVSMLALMLRAPLGACDVPLNIAFIEHTREPVDIWLNVVRDSVTTESSDCATVLILRESIARAAPLCGQHLAVDDLRALRAIIHSSANLFGPLFCCAMLHWILPNRPDLQLAAIDLDAVEVAMGLLKKGTPVLPMLPAGPPTEGMNVAVAMLSRIVRRNPVCIQMLATICIPVLVGKLKGSTLPGDLLLAVMDCCTEFAFNSGGLAAESQGCTAAVHHNCAPFQPINAFRTRIGVVPMCDFCSVAHPPVDSIALESDGHTCAYFTCRCPDCPTAKRERCLPPPEISLTLAQRLLGEQRVLQCATQHLRCWDEAANAVGRLSMRLECTEELGMALFLALVHRTSLNDCGDAAMAVAACQNLTKLQELKRKFRDSPLVRFLDADVVCASCDSTPEFGRTANGFGLTPSPGAAPREDHAGIAVELFVQ